jgi:hypothetical protein
VSDTTTVKPPPRNSTMLSISIGSVTFAHARVAALVLADATGVELAVTCIEEHREVWVTVVGGTPCRRRHKRGARPPRDLRPCASRWTRECDPPTTVDSPTSATTTSAAREPRPQRDGGPARNDQRTGRRCTPFPRACSSR